MSGGLLGFLGFDKRSKPNLNPDFQYPEQTQLSFANEDAKQGGYSLKELAKARIRAGQTGIMTPGIGFGPDFTSRMANPAIAKLDASFNESTVPRISSEASKRGIGRSNLVVNEIGRAEAEKNRDVADLMSKFEYLNKQQEKSDISEGIGLGERLDNQEADMLTNKAQASERLVDRTVGQSNIQNQKADKMQTATIAAAMNAAVPGSGTAFQMSQQPPQTAASQIPQASKNPTKANIIGMDNNSFEEWLNQYFGGA